MAERSNTDIAVAITIAISIGALVGWAGSDGGDRVGIVMPVFALCGALAFAINWLAFIPAVLKQTERYYDLVGGLTYITTTTVAVLLSSALDLRAMLVAGMVMVWSLRLATFLFRRILKSGKDSRFDAIKSRPSRFFMAWTLQGLWVLLTASAAWAVITGGAREPLGVVGIIGLAIWSIGIAIEIVADNQKSAFRRDSSNQGRFINTGLWSWSRHPNYFGEILLWAGMAIVALPVLHGWQYVTLISPVFVFVLLTRVSGVPLLEAQANQRWGGQDDYEDYKRRTSVLVLRPPAR